MSNNLPLIISQTNEKQAFLQQCFQQYGYLYFKKSIAPEKCNKLLYSFLDCLKLHIDYDETKQTPVLNSEPFLKPTLFGMRSIRRYWWGRMFLGGLA